MLCCSSGSNRQDMSPDPRSRGKTYRQARKCADLSSLLTTQQRAAAPGVPPSSICQAAISTEHVAKGVIDVAPDPVMVPRLLRLCCFPHSAISLRSWWPTTPSQENRLLYWPGTDLAAKVDRFPLPAPVGRRAGRVRTGAFDPKAEVAQMRYRSAHRCNAELVSAAALGRDCVVAIQMPMNTVTIPATSQTVTHGRRRSLSGPEAPSHRHC